MMARANPSPGDRIAKAWRFFSRLPGGKRLFSWLVGKSAPYTGTVGARIVILEPGYCRSELRERRKIRNHLASIHAVALVNLAEVTSGLALLTGLPPNVRGIVTGLSIDYSKKARGQLSAECRCRIPEVKVPMEHLLRTEVKDAGGDTVATMEVTWRLSPGVEGLRASSLSLEPEG